MTLARGPLGHGQTDSAVRTERDLETDMKPGTNYLLDLRLEDSMEIIQPMINCHDFPYLQGCH
jgi:hypothetical protein